MTTKTTTGWQEENGIALDRDQNQIHDYEKAGIIQTVTNHRGITAAPGGNALALVGVGDHETIAIKVAVQAQV
jgi:hypothetical protein